MVRNVKKKIVQMTKLKCILKSLWFKLQVPGRVWDSKKVQNQKNVVTWWERATPSFRLKWGKAVRKHFNKKEQIITSTFLLFIYRQICLYLRRQIVCRFSFPSCLNKTSRGRRLFFFQTGSAGCLTAEREFCVSNVTRWCAQSKNTEMMNRINQD